MTAIRRVDIPRDWQRPECRVQVEAMIKSSELPNGHKRAAYLRWLLQAGVPYTPQDLDRVITHRPIAAPTATELR